MTWFRHQAERALVRGCRAAEAPWSQRARSCGTARSARAGYAGRRGLTTQQGIGKIGGLGRPRCCSSRFPRSRPTASPSTRPSTRRTLHVEGEEELRASARAGASRAAWTRSTGHASTCGAAWKRPSSLDCSRCLEPYPLPLDQELDLFYLPRTPRAPTEEEEDEVELERPRHGRGLLRGRPPRPRRGHAGAVLPGLPLKPLCREDCQGRCPSLRRRTATQVACALPAAGGAAATRASLALKKLFDDESH